MRRRIWSEEVPAERLASREVVDLLARFGVSPVVAVRPSSRDARAALMRFRAAGLEPAIWPMLEDDDGRWFNSNNSAAFARFARDVAEEHASIAEEIAIDLEPPIAIVKRGLSGDVASIHRTLVNADRRRLESARRALAHLVEELDARGVRATAAIVPTLLAHPAWELALGTPLEGPRWSSVSAMFYTSMLEGWSRGLLRRADASAMLALSASAASSRFGARASVSLGVVSTGALGDEPTYRGPSELAEDVAVARAAGVDDLILFDLGGVLARPPAEAWLEAFVATPAASSLPSTLRARAADLSARGVGSALGFFVRSSAP